MKNRIWIILVLIISLPVIYFTAGGGAPPPGGPPPGGPPPGGAPPAGANMAVGPVGPNPSVKNVEFAYYGWVTKVTEGHIEIIDYKASNHNPWGEPMRIDFGRETKIVGGNLEAGQLVQITGIYPENGGPFTTNYRGHLLGIETYPRRGTIEIMKTYGSPF